MNEKVKPSVFQFRGYRILESSLKLDGEPIGTAMKFNITPRGQFKEGDKLDITLNIIVNDGDKHIQVSVVMAGYFTYECEDKHQLNQFVGLNAPAIMFPYIRSYVSCLTGLSGILPIVLPTINMESVGKMLIKQLEEQNK